MDKNLLNDATTTDDSPTPGYMLNEIARATTANYNANVQLQEFLVSRLSHKSHNVKWKCLVIIKHVCRTGRAEFKREMARRVDAIKECIQFRGTPDPIRGDELNKRVRDAAKEALDAIFDSQMPVTTSAVAAANRIQGMGNDYVPDAKPKESTGIISSLVSGIQNTILKDSTETAYIGNHGATGSFQTSTSRYTGPSGSGGYDSGKYSSSSSSSSMTGIGNPNFQDARQEKSWVQKASEAAQAIAGSALSGSGSSSSSNSGPMRSGTGTSDYNYATNRGANAYGMNDPSYNPRPMNAFGANGSNGGSSWQNGGLVSGGASGAATSVSSGVGRAGTAAADGTYEKAMIDALCEPGGLKPVPPEDKLQQFLVAAPTLSADLVGNCLADNLQSEHWQTRTKALLVIAALVKMPSCQSHVDWWLTNVEEVRMLLQDSKANVRTQTMKTLRAIGVEVAAGDSIIGTSPKPSNGMGVSGVDTGKSVSLLGDFEEISTATIASPSTSSTFNGQQPSPGGLFNDVQFSTTPAILTASTTSSSMFDGLALGGSSPSPVPTSLSPMTTNVPMNLQSPPVAPAASAFDFLDSMGGSSAPIAGPPSLPYSPAAAPPSAHAPATTSFSIFDALDNTPLMNAPLPSIMPSAAAPVSVPVVEPVTTGSAPSGFSFLSSPVVNNAADTISSAFVQQSGVDAAKEDSFAALSASYGLTPSSSSKTNNAVSAPINSMNTGNNRPMMYPPANNMNVPMNNNNNMYGGMGMPAAPIGGMNTGYGMNMMASTQGMPMGYNPHVSPLAPSMLSHNAPRKNIPNAEAAGTSGFNFMGTRGPAVGSANSTNSNNDSFDFVSQAMKGMK